MAGGAPRPAPPDGRLQLVPRGRLRPQQVAHEIIPAPPDHVRLVAEAVIAIRQQEQIEILIGFDQFVHYQQRVIRRHVVIQRAVRQQQMSLQVLGEQLVRLVVVIRGAVRIGFQQPLPLLGPIVFVFTIVVVTGLGDSHLEEIGVVEHRPRRRISSARVPVDARALDVDPRIALRQLLHTRHLVRQRIVPQIAEVGLVEFLAAPRRPHSIDLHHDESQLRQRLAVSARRREAAAAHTARLRTGVDVIHDRVLLRSVEVGRLEHQAVEIGDAVAGLHGERHRRLPSRGQQLGDIRVLQCCDQFAGIVAHHGRGRHIRLGVAIHEILAGRRERHIVIRVLRRQQSQILAVEADPIEVNEIRIALLAAHTEEVQHAILLVDAQHLRDVPIAGRDLIFQLAGLRIVEV